MMKTSEPEQELRKPGRPHSDQAHIDLISGSLFYHWIVTRFFVPSSSSSPVEWVEQMIDAVMSGIGTK